MATSKRSQEVTKGIDSMKEKTLRVKEGRRILVEIKVLGN